MPRQLQDDLLVDGRNLVSRLYSYRSCINGLPKAPADASTEQKGLLAKKIYEVLKPEIAKMWDFLMFRDHAVKTVSTGLGRATNRRHL